MPLTGSPQKFDRPLRLASMIVGSIGARLRERDRPAERPRRECIGRITVTSKKSESATPAAARRGRGVRVSPELAREMCTCGHRAGSHAALKYSCQAPGDHKGFCPCMRFLSAKEWRASKAAAS